MSATSIRSRRISRASSAVNVFVLEDDSRIAAQIQKGLTRLGHRVRLSIDGTHAYAALSEEGAGFDVAVIDRLVPGLDGLSLVRRLRVDGRRIPVLMLTALAGIEDRVQGLEAGADDYLAKPFALAELVARLAALVRRTGEAPGSAHLRAQDIEMDLLGRRVTRGGRTIALHPREFGLLEQLLRHSDGVVSRTMLLEKVWDFDFDPRTSVVETQVSRLRSKLNDGFGSDPIRTVRGCGYMIASTSEVDPAVE